YNVTTVLVNQLDLYLVSPSLQIYRPWILNPAFPSLPAGTGIDSANVVECVHVNAPQPGVWTLFVSGILPGSETQTFGVAGNVALNPDMAHVSGTIRDSQTGEPLPARVEIAGSESFVNARDDGVYHLPVLRNSVFSLRAWIYGCAPDIKVVTVGDVPEVLQDFTLSSASLGTFEGYVFNTNRGPVAGAAISLTDTPLPAVRTNSAGFFHLIAPGGTDYHIAADYEGCRDDMTEFLPESQVVPVEFHLFDCRFNPTPPDAYGYLAYEQNDIEAPAEFDWLEISPTSGGPGEAVEFSSGNSLEVISLPFIFRYYGQDFDAATLSADGYLAMGITDEADNTQSPIPHLDGPAGMLAPFWDNLDVTEGGDVSTYHDAFKGRFIIEFNGVPQQRQTDSLVTFQLILFDPFERSTPSCDGEIVFQYALCQYFCDERNDGGTVGIESPDEHTGVQIVYDGIYNLSAFPIRCGTAIRFTTIEWEAFGSVTGTIEMIPPVIDVSEVDIAFGCHRAHPDNAGHFQVDSVAVGIYRMQASYPGYEVGVLEIEIDSVFQTIAAFELWRLDPPQNLDGSAEDSIVTLRWSPPHFRIPETTSPKGGSTISSLSNYHVYCNGEFRAAISDTTYTETAAPGNYDYWVTAIYTGGESDTSNHARIAVVSSGGQTDIGVPDEFFILQNYPNPFNAVTRIEFGLPQRTFVELEVFDILGRKVAVLARDYREAGYHSILFDAGGLPSGIYFCRMHAAEFLGAQKMLLIK
ncbi:T9SS type A sorting domain-containing protein, partial [bacterium]|nr:T9SS type A sorting domain-containing protein [bacterium]